MDVRAEMVLPEIGSGGTRGSGRRKSKGSSGTWEVKMAQVFFHCSTTQGVLIDRHGASVADLIEAREQAASVVRSLIATPTLEDWRGWMLHVNDEDGEELFILPFGSVIGKPH
jgi:uncharacterized protein DUF6894